MFPRGRVAALRNVTLEIGAGDYTAIIGPSGSGKSTLLYLAGGLDRPTSGRVLFEGREPRTPAQWAELRACRIGFVFQSFHLVGGLTAAENVEISMLGRLRGERERRKRAAGLLERVGLGHRIHHRAADLSGGESQRVAIARAMANAPDVILADEPTGNLDSQSAGEVLDLLEDLHRSEGVALAMVTHDTGVSARAGRVVRLFDGRVVPEGGLN